MLNSTLRVGCTRSLYAINLHSVYWLCQRRKEAKQVGRTSVHSRNIFYEYKTVGSKQPRQALRIKSGCRQAFQDLTTTSRQRDLAG